MAINQGDWQAIDRKIATSVDTATKPLSDAIDSLRPSGIKKALFWLRQLGPIIAVASFLFVIIVFAATQYNAANSRLAAEAAFQTKTDDRLKAIESSLLALRSAQVVVDPGSKKSQDEAKSILADARKGTAPIPTKAVEQTGSSFIDAARTQPNAWDVALDFVNYRSSLNQNPIPLMLQTKIASIPNVVTHYRTNFPSNRSGPSLEHIYTGTVPFLSGAKCELIAAPFAPDPPGSPFGDDFIILRGGAFTLDNVHLRHAVFFGVEVHYRGGPVILEDVTFVNCTFVMENIDPARKLGLEMLTSRTVNFQTTA